MDKYRTKKDWKIFRYVKSLNNILVKYLKVPPPLKLSEALEFLPELRYIYVTQSSPDLHFNLNIKVCN